MSAAEIATEWIAALGDTAAGKGFWGNNPHRWWVALNSPDARTWPTREGADRWAASVGDSSWGWTVLERPVAR
jgi:hypothetical protein